MPTSPIATFSDQRVDPLKAPQSAHMEVLQLAEGTYAKGTLLGELVGVNEVQQIAITGSPTGGDFTVTFDGQTTGAIAHNATAAQVVAALEALSNIADEDVAATGGPLPGTPVVVTFQGLLGRENVPQMTTTDSLTGGTTPASAVTTVTAGSAGTPGTYKKYDPDNTDGSQYPTHILRYACVVDANGNVTIGDSTVGGEYSQTHKGAEAWRCGLFDTRDLVGLDETAVTRLGRLVGGTIESGRLMVYGN